MKKPVVVVTALIWVASLSEIRVLAAEPPGKPIKTLRRLDETIRRFGGHGDNWHMSWADNDKVYVSLCDGRGLPGAAPITLGGDALKLEHEFNSRMYAIQGDMPQITFEYLAGYPNLLNEPNRLTSRYYNFGTLALDGRLYQFLSTPNNPFNEPHPRFVGAKLIYSPDNGQSWRNQGVVQDQNWPLGSRHPGFRRRKMPGEDDAFIDARIAEEPISGLRRCPILTGRGECFANLLAHFAKHFAQPQLQALVGKLTPR